jgi:uncharacterized protein YqhQ
MAEGPMSVGGQAILEGVMMRSPHSLAIAVRRPGGEIVVKEDAWHSIWERAKVLRRPLLRGAVVLFESLYNGIQALTFSADQAARHADNGPQRPDASGAAPQEAPVGKGDDAEVLGSWAIAGTIALSLALGFGLFAALPHFLTWLAGIALGNKDLASGKALAFQAVDGVVKVAFLVGYLAAIARLPEIRRVFQYHGAEHKSIWCYEDGHALTVENARSYTTLHPRCGTSFLLITVVVSILLFSVVFPLMPDISERKWLNQLAYVFIKVPLMFPVAGIAYEATRLSARFPRNPIVRLFTWPGLMLQHITTKEPDDQQLEIALVALQMTLRREAALAAGDSAASVVQEPEVFDSYAAFLTKMGGAIQRPVQLAA